MKKRWKKIIVIGFTLIIGVFIGAFASYKIGSKNYNEVVEQLQDATGGLMLYYLGYQDLSKAINEFYKAYPMYAQYLTVAPSFKNHFESGMYEKIKNWEAKEHTYNCDGPELEF